MTNQSTHPSTRELLIEIAKMEEATASATDDINHIEEKRDEEHATAHHWNQKAEQAVLQQRDDLATAALGYVVRAEKNISAHNLTLINFTYRIEDLGRSLGELRQKLDDAKAYEQAELTRLTVTERLEALKKNLISHADGMQA